MVYLRCQRSMRNSGVGQGHLCKGAIPQDKLDWNWLNEREDTTLAWLHVASFHSLHLPRKMLYRWTATASSSLSGVKSLWQTHASFAFATVAFLQDWLRCLLKQYHYRQLSPSLRLDIDINFNCGLLEGDWIAKENKGWMKKQSIVNERRRNLELCTCATVCRTILLRGVGWIPSVHPPTDTNTIVLLVLCMKMLFNFMRCLYNII